MSSDIIKWGGLASMVGGALGIMYFPFHASAYFATEDGATSLGSPWFAAWSGAFRSLFEPLLTFASPNEVYVTYGKVALLVSLGFLAGVLALHARQTHRAGRLEKWGFRVVLVGTVLLTLGTFGEYYTPYLDFSFLALSVPGIISLMLGSTLFGISTLGAKVAPRLAAYARRLPWDNPETVLFGHLSGGLVAT